MDVAMGILMGPIATVLPVAACINGIATLKGIHVKLLLLNLAPNHGYLLANTLRSYSRGADLEITTPTQHCITLLVSGQSELAEQSNRSLFSRS